MGTRGACLLRSSAGKMIGIPYAHHGGYLDDLYAEAHGLLTEWHHSEIERLIDLKLDMVIGEGEYDERQDPPSKTCDLNWLLSDPGFSSSDGAIWFGRDSLLCEGFMFIDFMRQVVELHEGVKTTPHRDLGILARRDGEDWQGYRGVTWSDEYDRIYPPPLIARLSFKKVMAHKDLEEIFSYQNA